MQSHENHEPYLLIFPWEGGYAVAQNTLDFIGWGCVRFTRARPIGFSNDGRFGRKFSNFNISGEDYVEQA